MHIVIAGGSGFIGRGLAAFLAGRGHAVAVLTRSPRQPGDVAWDGCHDGPWQEVVRGADAVVNLTGKRIDCRFTPANRQAIVESRINAVRAILRTVAGATTPPRVLVQAGAIGFYGDTAAPCGEDAPPGAGFLAEVCRQWEAAFLTGPLPQTRRCLLRIGLVLGPGGGALQPLARLARLFLGGAAGRGNQYMSWIHQADLHRIVLACMEDAAMTGVFNAVGPGPVTNRVFMATLRRALGRPWSPPVPVAAIRFGARFLMRVDPAIILTGQNVRPVRLLAAGFHFAYPDLAGALQDLYGTGTRPGPAGASG